MPAQGTRKVPFSRELYVERDDFREDPPKDWFRLAPGREVRLRYACLVTCTRRREGRERRGDRAALHAGSGVVGRQRARRAHRCAARCTGCRRRTRSPAEVRLYDRLFSVENPGTDEGSSFLDEINPESLVRVDGRDVEPTSATREAGRRASSSSALGYFCVDRDSRPGKPSGTARWRSRTAGRRSRTKRDKQGEAGARSRSRQGAEGTEGEAPKPAPPPAEIGIDDFGKVDLRVGIVQVGGAGRRAPTSCSSSRSTSARGGCARSSPACAPAIPIRRCSSGKRVVVVANLKPRQMKFGLSEGMILAAAAAIAAPVVTFDDGRRDAPEPGDKIS